MPHPALKRLNPFHLLGRVQGQPILNDLNLSFRSGEFIGIFGPTGSGKSTLILSLLKQFKRTGNVWLDGIPYAEYYQRYFHEVGFVPQDDIMHRELTVGETLSYSIKLRGLAKRKKEIAEHIQNTIEILGLQRTVNITIGDEHQKGISGGQRKRVNLGLEILSEHLSLLMLDEPTSGLDPTTEEQIHQLLQSLAQKNLIVLMVSHSLYGSLTRMLDKILVLTKEGDIAYFGPSSAVLEYFDFDIDSLDEIFTALSQHPREIAVI